MFSGDDRIEALLEALDLLRPELHQKNIRLDVYGTVIDSIYQGAKPNSEDLEVIEQLTKLNLLGTEPRPSLPQTFQPQAPHVQPSLAFTSGRWQVPAQPIVPSNSAALEESATRRPVHQSRRLREPLPPPPDTRPAEYQYAEQLKQMKEMGFYDEEKNVAALRRRKGDVHGAVEELLTNDL
ncbi:MAG: hypothetical protein Q9223_000491 [Gallowayella weberi]